MKRVYWVPTEEWRAEEQARYDAYLAANTDDDGTLQIRVMGRGRRAVCAIRDWWRMSWVNVPKHRRRARGRAAFARMGIDPRDPNALKQILGRWHLQQRSFPDLDKD